MSHAARTKIKPLRTFTAAFLAFSLAPVSHPEVTRVKPIHMKAMVAKIIEMTTRLFITATARVIRSLNPHSGCVSAVPQTIIGSQTPKFI